MNSFTQTLMVMGEKRICSLCHAILNEYSYHWKWHQYSNIWYKARLNSKIEVRLTEKSVEIVDDITPFDAFTITFIFRLLYILKAIKDKYNRKESAN